MVMRVVNVEMSVEMSVEMVMLKELVPSGYLPTTKPITPHPIPNQSKPIVPLLSFSFIITFSYIFITISYNL